MTVAEPSAVRRGADWASLSAVFAPVRTPDSHEPAEERGIDPAQCALVVLDYQPAVLHSVRDPDRLISGVNAVADDVRRAGGHVAYVRTAFKAADYRFIASTNRALSAVAADWYLQDGTPVAALHEAVDHRPDDISIRKVRVGAFCQTNLDERLTNRGVTTLLLAGVHTSGVVLSTLREAADRDYRIIVLRDCVADADPELHDLLMNRVFPSQADAMTARDVCAGFSRS
ncbi:cysteine hydrolase family protein [Mycobacterium camsae]|uniref:cysteine hydrolase family protein n=1 Tax=Mycobacterium gordonae TaxID=1778 RepID=UPI00197E01BA|nr:cysteine hydrolase [Mycobacterium gordonae]